MKVIALLLTTMLALTACDNKKSSKHDPANAPESPKGDRVEDEDTIGALTVSGNWYVQDPTLDGVEGTGSARAIQEFALKHEKEIIVAVIDSGVDVNHEDLQGKIWKNPGESGADASGKDKASNGVDDDKNGYVDDVHGWNFIGGTDGSHVDHDTLEVTREMVRLEKRIAAGERFTAAEQAYFDRVKKYYDDSRVEADGALAIMGPIEAKATPAKELLKTKLGFTDADFTVAKLTAINSTEQDVNDAKALLLSIAQDYGSVARFYRVFDYYNNIVTYYLNKAFNPRTVVGDDPDDFSQTSYGNNDVGGPDPMHGTHVAGIIAAVRGNGKGADGIAQNVKIMVLRVVPDGDERDKDVAMAVRYAANNGAHIINQSFGKAFSPHKARVDEAYMHAVSKGVLVFHSAGNDSEDHAVTSGYPNRFIEDSVVRGFPETIPTWLEIGASAAIKGLDMVAVFSDYGKVDVDIFSPGVNLLSTTPGNTYQSLSGTSMAGPAAAGVAALMMSNFPTMTAKQTYDIIGMKARQYNGLLVRKPGADRLDVPVPFADLSRTGGIIDAYENIKLARELSGP